MTNPTYQAERARAIDTLSSAVSTYRSILQRREGYFPDSEDAATLTAYTGAQMALLQLLKEQANDQRKEGGGDRRREVSSKRVKK